MTMKSPWKQQQQQQGAENNRGISHHMLTLHQRLYHALRLGSYVDKGKKLHFADIEIQRLVIRSIDAFLDSVTPDTSHHPLVKDSIADIVKALECILLLRNGAILSLASNVAVKMANVLPNSVLQPHLLDIIRPMTSLLPSHQKQVAILCATALNLILPESSKKDGEVWEILKEADAVNYIVNNIQSFSSEAMPIEYFQEMVSLLSKILWRWPPSRYCVWNNARLMETIRTILIKPNFSVRIAILQLYSAVALCGNGAQKLLEKEETLLSVIKYCLASSTTVPVQVEGLKLIQCLVMNEQGCMKVMDIGGELIAKAIIDGIKIWRCNSGKVPKDQLSLFMEACRLALVTRWAGVHHNYLWKFGIDKVLLHLILDDLYKNRLSEESLSLEEQIAIARKGLGGDFPHTLRSLIWDIVGGLAVHCADDFKPKLKSHELAIDLLITCVCLVFKDSFQFYQSDPYDIFMHEAAARSVLMMIYAPCKYIASQAQSILSEILRESGRQHLKYLLQNLSNSRNKFEMVDSLQIVVNLMRLVCYSGLTHYQKNVIEGEGITILVACMRSCLRNDVRVKRSVLSPHWRSTSIRRSCCWVNTEDWDGEDLPLLFCLWGLAELIHHHRRLKYLKNMFAGQVDHSEAHLISELKSICYDIPSPGPRWYAAYILTYFGYYGFPSKLGKRMEKLLHETDFSDVELVLRSGESLNVHGVLLMVRCPSLIPPNEIPSSDMSPDGQVKKMMGRFGTLRKVPLSAQVERQALTKLLEYVYLGYSEVEDEDVKKLKSLAKSCNLQCLVQMLSKKRPRWGAPYPKSDVAFALEPDGHCFSDIILEAKGTDQNHWTCSSCSVSPPHLHVHKVMLWSSCDYFQALLRSGMQESRSETIKVPVSFEALVKLVNWIYSDELPKPVSGCLWDNMDTDKKLYELHPYVELCWLAEFWLVEVIHEHCTQVVISSLGSARELSIKIIEIAANLSQWRIAEAAAKYMAPSYHKLRNSGELDELDEGLVDMVRSASVRLSQGGL